MTGTIMERSHAKLTQWAAAFHMGASSKKGFSAHQLHRELGCQYNTAWFLHHRVMEAMRRGGLDLPPMGGEGKVVEADETYLWKIPEAKRPTHKTRGTPYQNDARGPKNKRVIEATSQFLSAGCAAFISTARRNICIATWRNLISATTIVPRLGTTTQTARLLR